MRKHLALVKQKNEKAEEKLMSLRKELTTVKTELSSRERQLDVAKKMLSKVSQEKKDALLDHEAIREKNRRLERAIQ
jgi:hypothetical protein